MANASRESAAWLLSLDSRWRAAVGEREMVHLVERPILLEVPKTPLHCRQVLVWNEEVLPALDLASWLAGERVQRMQTAAGIFAYQQRAEAPVQYGALLLADVPARITVSDDQACELPEPEGWRELAIACFTGSTGDPVPVLDLAYVFSDALVRT